MGINETIADTRHWITEHKLKAIGQILATCFQLLGTNLTFDKLHHDVVLQVAFGAQE